MLFCEVYHQLQFGHKVKRASWPEDTYVRMYVIPVNGFATEKGLYLCSTNHKEYYKPEQEDLLANDWEYGGTIV